MFTVIVKYKMIGVLRFMCFLLFSIKVLLQVLLDAPLEHRGQNSFYDELFCMGSPQLASFIPRLKATNNSVRETLDPKSEPKFDSMQAVHSLID